jgi:hypothetical protein
MRVAVRTTPENDLDEVVILDCPFISMEMISDTKLLIKLGDENSGVYHFHVKYDNRKLNYLLTKENDGVGKSSNGRTTDSDSVYEGSNPSFPAKNTSVV